MRFVSLAHRNLKELYRDPLAVGLGVAMPVGLLALFVSIFKEAHLEMFSAAMLTPGLTVFSFAFLIMSTATLLVKDRQSAFLTRLMATPLKPVDFILAYLLPLLSVACLQIAACYLVGALLGFRLNMGALASLIVMLPAALTCIGLGMILGTLCTEGQVAGFGSILISAISLFSGAWWDVKMVGGFFTRIAYALPFAHAIDAARALDKGAGFVAIAADLYWLYGYAAAFFVLGILAFAWRTRR